MKTRGCFNLDEISCDHTTHNLSPFEVVSQKNYSENASEIRYEMEQTSVILKAEENKGNLKTSKISRIQNMTTRGSLHFD